MAQSQQATQDSVIINRDALTKKEMFLKERLYKNTMPKTMSNIAKGLTQPKQVTIKEDPPIHGNQKPVGEWPTVERPTSGEILNKNFRSQRTDATAAIQHHQTQLQQVTDNNMNTFLDEMRQQFMQTQNVNVIPQSLMYRQTQLMESQVQMLESNQKQMGEVINNIMNQTQTGHESGASIKQNIFNENRRMMLEMMVPLNQQLNDMKLLYENTKNCSTDVETKIDELKRVMVMQQNALGQGGAPGSLQSQTQAQPMATGGMFSDAGLLDPTILQKGIATIKEQMKDVQREALSIETEMEKRFSDMIHKNSQRRYLPQSLTEEILAHKQKLNEQNIRETIGEVRSQADRDNQSMVDGGDAPLKYGYAQIREAITERLGGPFDYTGFQQELKDLTSAIPSIQRDFKIQGEKYAAPDLREGFQRVPPFKFTLPEFDDSSIFTVDPIFGAQKPSSQSAQTRREENVSYKKAKHLSAIHTEPQYLISSDLKTIEREAVGERATSQPQIYRPQTSASPSPSPQMDLNEPGSRQTIESKRVNDTFRTQSFGKAEGSARPGTQQSSFIDLHNDVEHKAPTPKQEDAFKQTDILTLKKMVIDEIKSELQLTGQGKGTFPGVSRPGYVDPFSRLDQKQNQKEGDHIAIKGGKAPKITLSEDDDLNDQNAMIVANATRAQAALDQELEQNQSRGSAQRNESARQSVQTIISRRESMSESQVLNAIADVIMQEVNGGTELEASMSMSQKGFTRSIEKQIGEDLIVEKINQIFDEVARDRQDFEESYMSLSGMVAPGAKKSAQGTSSKDSDKKPDVATTSIQVHEASLMGLDRMMMTQMKTQKSAGAQGLEAGAPVAQAQPLIMPIIVNADGSAGGAIHSAGAGVDLGDVHKLKDMISQAVQDQFSLHAVRKEHGLSQPASLGQTFAGNEDNPLKDEENKLGTEQRLLRQQIPINVGAQMQAQTAVAGQPQQSYQNPFFFTASQQHPPTMAQQRANIYQSMVQPPLVVDQLLSDCDSSDIFTEDATKSYYKSNYVSNLSQNRQMVRGYERSEGEVGAPLSGEDVHSEMRFPSNPRSVGLNDRQQHGFSSRQQRSITPNVVQRPGRHHELGETYDYEENKAMIAESEVERPVYDSSDGPVPKGGRGAGRGKSDVFVSGESFGGQKGFKAGGAGMKASQQKRETIGETFLEDDESDLDESGEIDPRLFR